VDKRTRTIQTKSDPSNAGTKQLIKISESIGDQSDAEKDDGISYIASPQQTDHDVIPSLDEQ
jgi:hypothetical protein